MKSSFSKGFTLIELLVVISIISMLSSIVIVSVQSAREKARIAAGIHQNSALYQAYGAEALGWWKMDSLISSCAINDYTNVCDNSPNVSIAPIKGPDGSNAYSFNGSDSKIDFSKTISFNSSPFTLSAWVYNIEAGSQERSIIASNALTAWSILGINNYLRIYSKSGSFFTSSNIIVQRNKWSFVVTSYDGSNIRFYVDGKITNVISGVSGLSFDFNNIAGKSSYYFLGYIDDVKIYNQALGSAQIQKMYADGAKTHGLALNSRD